MSLGLELDCTCVANKEWFMVAIKLCGSCMLLFVHWEGRIKRISQLYGKQGRVTYSRSHTGSRDINFMSS